MVGEVFQASVGAIRGEILWLLGLLVASLLLVLSERLLGRLPARGRRIVVGLALAVTGASAVRLAWKDRFLCDDAFISFRYARNFAQGHGLVWNPGQWVEGYTDFLWTLILGVLGWFRLEIPLAALALCLVSLLAAIVATAMAVRRIGPPGQVVPFAAIAIGCMTPFATFGTSGLETMFAAALIIAGVAAGTRSPARAGLFLTLSTLARPDHALFLLAYGLALVVEDLWLGQGKFWRRLEWGRYARFAAPFVLLFVPYFFWRWHAYGQLFPNTFYAKSGGGTYYSQGFVWVLDFVGSTGAWLWVPVGLASLIGRVRSASELRLRVFALASTAIFTAYVLRVGGDFMEWRFFIPLLPVVAVLLEVRIRLVSWGASLAVKLPWAVIGAATMAAAILPVHLVKPWEKRWMLSWEASFYRIHSLKPLHIESIYDGMGHQLAENLTDHGVAPPLGLDSIGIVGWFSRLPMIDNFGLTNVAIGHKPITSRGRPGHEKYASPDEMVEQGAVIGMSHMLDPGFEAMTEATVKGFAFHFLRLDPGWASAVAAIPGAVVPDPVRDATDLARTAPREKVLSAQRFYRRFLRGNPVEARVQEILAQRLAAVADFETSLPAGTIVTGTSLGVRNGPPPAGATGLGWLGSVGVAGTGRAAIPIEKLPGTELRFALGGASSPSINVRLLVEGQQVGTVAPSGLNVLEPASLSLQGLEGKSATLFVDDGDPDPASGILLDDVHFPAPQNDVRTRIAAVTPATLVDLLGEAETELPLSDPDRQALESRVAFHFDLDRLPPGTRVTGTAFGPGPESGNLPGQAQVAGFTGRYLSSYHGKDEGTGRVELPEIVVPEGPISVRVAGGSDCNHAYVGLQIPGRGVVARVCGRNDEVLRPALLATGAFVGQRGQIVIVDETTAGWGHILADEVVGLNAAATSKVTLRPVLAR